MGEQRHETISVNLVISSDEALNGTTRTLTLPDGRQITAHLPAGIRDGQEIRLDDQGAQLPERSPHALLILTISVIPAGLKVASTTYPDPETAPLAPPPPPPRYPPSDPYNAPSPYAQVTDPSTQPPAGKPQRRFSPAMALLAFLILLLLLGAGGFLYYLTALSPARSQKPPPATPRIGNSLTATATRLQNIYAQATGDVPAISDPLSQQDGNNWDEDANCAFKDGAYHASSSQSDTFFACNAVATLFDNFAYQVQMTIIKGDYGGIVFRSDSAAANTYIFTVDQTGSYSFNVYKNDNQFRTLGNGLSATFKTGLNKANVLTVIATSSAFYLYINGQFLTSASDTTFRSGQVGVLAGENTNLTEVVFRDLKVWRI